MVTLVMNNRIYFRSSNYAGWFDGEYYHMTILGSNDQFDLRFDEEWDEEFEDIKESCWRAAVAETANNR